MTITEIRRFVARRTNELYRQRGDLEAAAIWETIRPEIGAMNGARDIIIDEWGCAQVARIERLGRNDEESGQLALLPEYQGCKRQLSLRVNRDGKMLRLPTVTVRYSELDANVERRDAQIARDTESLAYPKSLRNDLRERREAAGITADRLVSEDLKLPKPRKFGTTDEA